MRRVGMGASWLDVKLAGRMLVRYPGLTAVSVLGIAVAIAITGGALGIMGAIMNPALPLDEGDRIVALQNWDLERRNPNPRVLHDFLVWRESLREVVDVGAYRTVGRNLIAPGDAPETVRVAEMSAAGFRLARVEPLAGRFLHDADERPDAPPVVVIGEELWARRFGADPDLIGSSIQLGEAHHTVVGIMPAPFGFPVSHDIWVPLRVEALRAPRGEGPALSVFARLAPGASFESAQAELTAAGERASAAFPDTHARLRPQVQPYTYPVFDMDDPENRMAIGVMRGLILILLIVVSINVAILVYARTATRQGEIALRGALGARRSRIVAQLFVEAMALAGLAALAGLGVLAVALRYIDAAMLQIAGRLPFWVDFGLSGDTVLYIVGLTVLAAAIVGIVPALKATGPRVQTDLQALTAGGGAGMRLGRLWTFLIIAQVAFAVALLPTALHHGWQALRAGSADPGFPAAEYLTGMVTLDRGAGTVPVADTGFDSRFTAGHRELLRRLGEEPVVADVTFAVASPGAEGTVVIEVEGVRMPERDADYNIVAGARRGHLARFNRVAVNYFEVFEVPLLTGRGFGPADAGPGASTVVVNRAFVDRMFAVGENPIGRRVRYVGRSGDADPEHVQLDRWYEIAGVVGNFPSPEMEESQVESKLYHAAAPGSIYPATLAVRVAGTPAPAFGARLRELAAAVDPNIQIRSIATLEEALRRGQDILRVLAASLLGVTLAIVGLAAAGIYAMMSLTVSRRRREIGIRAALGADPRRILRGIFSRAAAQLALGAAVGAIGAIGVGQITEGGPTDGQSGPIILATVAAFMMLVGLAAAIGPARRGLRIQPIEALKNE